MINHPNRNKSGRLTVKERAAAGSALNFALAGEFDETFGRDCGFTREDAKRAQLKIEGGATIPILPDFLAAARSAVACLNLSDPEREHPIAQDAIKGLLAVIGEAEK